MRLTSKSLADMINKLPDPLTYPAPVIRFPVVEMLTLLPTDGGPPEYGLIQTIEFRRLPGGRDWYIYAIHEGIHTTILHQL